MSLAIWIGVGHEYEVSNDWLLNPMGLGVQGFDSGLPSNTNFLLCLRVLFSPARFFAAGD
jgi:hypothetical protein